MFSGPELTPEERSILAVLQNCRGQKLAIRVPDLADRVGMDDRTVRKVVKHLVEFHHLSIGSTPSNTPGYYMIMTAEEAWEVFKSLRRRALSILRRASVIRKMTLPKLLGQLQFEVTKNPELDLEK